METVANDPAVKANAALSKLIEAAVKKAEKSESIRSIASNLDTQLLSNFAEN
ncbi:bacteriocin immunity protein, partial [Lactobacillus delbrueckii subsp. bulgaricus]